LQNDYQHVQHPPLKTFIIYAHADRAYKDALVKNLKISLVQAKRIDLWHDDNIPLGAEWDKTIKKHLESADLVLILVSAAALASDYISSQELRITFDRLREGVVRVVPIIVEHCPWEFNPILAGLQGLPQDMKPVSDHANQNQVWTDIIRKLNGLVEAKWREDDEKIAQTESDRIAAQAEADRIAAEKRAADQEALAKKAEQDRLALLSAQQREQEAAQQRLAEQQRKDDIRREAERLQRERDEKAEQERIAAEKQRQAADAQREATEKAERLRLAQQERDRERKEQYDQSYAHAQTTDDIPTWQAFLNGQPTDVHAREARLRIKALKGTDSLIPAWAKYSGIACVCLFSLWFLGRGCQPEQQVEQKPTTVQPSETVVQPQQDPNPHAETKPAQTLPTANTTTQPEPKPTEKLAIPDPHFTFDYPMVRVEGGSFTMGSPTSETGRYSNECQFDTSVSSFSIGKYEVTQAQWKAVMGKNPSSFKNCDNCPVENVTYGDVQKFIKALNIKTGYTYRLPKEIEWEYAARGGKESTGYLYAGSNNLDDVAWYGYSKSGQKTHPVGTKADNELDIHDMSGNVREWCQDTYKPYSCDTKNTSDGSNRVNRGGSWSYNPQNCRVANRNYNSPGYSNYNLGFRLARTN
jgi:formylglycine-generating enzyme required for sulfatase activity